VVVLFSLCQDLESIFAQVCLLILLLSALYQHLKVKTQPLIPTQLDNIADALNKLRLLFFFFNKIQLWCFKYSQQTSY